MAHSTTTTAAITTPAAATDRERTLVAWAATLGPVLAEHAGHHDCEGTWVRESFEHLRRAGLLALAVPADLGGTGATIRQTAMVMRELAHYCGATALAMSMHQHVTAATAWRYRRRLPGAEETLRSIANDEMVMVSTGGADFTRPRGTSVRVDGGFRVSGRKMFASQSPVGTALVTMFPFDDPEQGRRILNMTLPLAEPGVMVDDNWDALGMRGTASNDVVIDDVFVPDERVAANRPYGVIDPPLQLISSIGGSIVSAVYLGVAESAANSAVDHVAGTQRAEDPSIQRLVGVMRTRLQVASWALDGALAVVGDDPEPSMTTMAAVMAAKAEIARTGIEACDLAMDVAGGGAFFKGSPIERAYRDIRGVKFHQLQPEATLLHAGRLSLGLPCDER